MATTLLVIATNWGGGDEQLLLFYNRVITQKVSDEMHRVMSSNIFFHTLNFPRVKIRERETDKEVHCVI